jgi:hypothetical protein
MVDSRRMMLLWSAGRAPVALVWIAHGQVDCVVNGHMLLFYFSIVTRSHRRQTRFEPHFACSQHNFVGAGDRYQQLQHSSDLQEHISADICMCIYISTLVQAFIHGGRAEIQRGFCRK